MSEPDTKRALLWCDSCAGPTLHAFEGEQVFLSGFAAWLRRFMYACSKCGRLRSWGVEAVTGKFGATDGN